MRLGTAKALAFVLLAIPASAQVVHVSRGAGGIDVDWTGGPGAADVVAVDLAQVRDGSIVDLGSVRALQCGSTSQATRDAVTGTTLVGYLVGSGGDYGPTSNGKPKRASSGDCVSSAPLTQAQFCSRWIQDSRIDAVDPWTGNPDPQGCDAGTIDRVGVADGLRRTNLYRWMCGLAPLVEDAALSAKSQQGAALLRGIGYLTHQPEPGSPCYTADGDVACGSSNICAGYPTLPDAVDAYVADYGVSSLGHRRWLLHPPLQKTGFGFVEGAGTYAVQWVIGSGSTTLPAYVAWPSPGWFPHDAPLGRWSFQVKNASFTGATVTVTRVSDGRAMSVSGVEQLPNGYGWACLAYDVAGCLPGQEYRVVVDGVTGTAQSRYEYVTSWCDCY